MNKDIMHILSSDQTRITRKNRRSAHQKPCLSFQIPEIMLISVHNLFTYQHLVPLFRPSDAGKSPLSAVVALD